MSLTFIAVVALFVAGLFLMIYVMGTTHERMREWKSFVEERGLETTSTMHGNQHFFSFNGAIDGRDVAGEFTRLSFNQYQRSPATREQVARFELFFRAPLHRPRNMTLFSDPFFRAYETRSGREFRIDDPELEELYILRGTERELIDAIVRRPDVRRALVDLGADEASVKITPDRIQYKKEIDIGSTPPELSELYPKMLALAEALEAVDTRVLDEEAPEAPSSDGARGPREEEPTQW
jgi:hypothetical protein